MTLVTRRTESELQRDRRYRERHRDEIRQYARRWVVDNREKVAAKERRWRAADPIRACWVQYRSTAKAKSLAFDLDRQLFDDLVTDCCFYCGAEPLPTNGIDRVDNNVGYIFGNVVTACRPCNMAKRNMSAATFVVWLDRLTAKFSTWREAFV